MKTRKIPMRMCVGCREMKEKRSLLRIVKSPDNVISFDRVGKAPGRGAYVCPNKECIMKAVKEKRLERALEKPISDAVTQQLLEDLEHGQQ